MVSNVSTLWVIAVLRVLESWAVLLQPDSAISWASLPRSCFLRPRELLLSKLEIVEIRQYLIAKDNSVKRVVEQAGSKDGGTWGRGVNRYYIIGS